MQIFFDSKNIIQQYENLPASSVFGAQHHKLDTVRY